MKKFLAVVILVPIAIIAVALSVANRHAVALSLDPFNSTDPAVVISMPLFVLVFGAIALGVLIGGVGAWLGQGRWRRQARKLRHELQDTRLENTQYRAAASASPATTLPAPRRVA
ncbi:LapA family protein [Kaistia defluvii]|uniref:LapA family protein n=1 Tax=Kaistia defluvii TaxID=410841 RepID=UPI002251D9BA|nr:LapA family protein [Kaistia defluvii]MCX5520591.1 LapA family protein [Kaistia defluvii]